MITDLSREEKFLLVWLSKEDRNSFGECRSYALTRLIDLGLAKLDVIDEIDSNYWNVACTEAGYQRAATIPETEI